MRLVGKTFYDDPTLTGCNGSRVLAPQTNLASESLLTSEPTWNAMVRALVKVSQIVGNQ
jgi:hypothetical protein